MSKPWIFIAVSIVSIAMVVAVTAWVRGRRRSRRRFSGRNIEIRLHKFSERNRRR
jgi:type II secretory pathway pseudopilin PulG